MAGSKQQRANIQSQGSVQVSVGAAVVILLTVAHVLTYWNRFLAPSMSGMFMHFGWLTLKGVVPYRDFFMVIPPFFTFKTAAVIEVFGRSVAAQRVVEIVTRSVVCGVVFVWLVRLVGVPRAAFATILGGVLFSGDTADAVSSYQHESVFWAVMAGFVLSYAGREQRRRDVLLFAGSGLCAAISFITKQTTGAGITVALFVVVAVLTFRRERTLLALIKNAGTYTLGWMVPMATLAWWLGIRGAWHDYITDVFIIGPSSKGSLGTILLRPFVEGPGLIGHVELIVAAVAAGALVFVIIRGSAEPAPDNRAWIQLWWYAAVCAAAIAAGAAISYRAVRLPGASLFGECEFLAMRIGLMGSVAIGGYYTWRVLRAPLSDLEWQRWMLALVSLSTAYMLSLSWTIYAPMAMPAVAFVAAVAFTEMRARTVRVLRYAIEVGCVGLLLIASYQKPEIPFSWIGWTDPPARTAIDHSHVPALTGILLAPEVKQFADEMVRLIQQHSKQDEPIFIFSYAPMFYVLTDRRPPTLGQVHFFDVAPDALCRDDAKRLEEANPAVIVDFVMTPEEFRVNEQIFRHGARSGQRDLYETMYGMIQRGYHLASVLREPGSGHDVRVFVKNAAGRV